jgi:hypothetical protein
MTELPELTELPIKYREATEGDMPFIFSTWLKSYRNSDWARQMSNDIFYSQHKAVVAHLLSKAQITMITSDTQDDEIYGYTVASVIGSTSVVHFCYVKYNFRKLGLMSGLVKHLGYFKADVNFITHLPRRYKQLQAKLGLEFNPYMLLDI